MVSYYLQFAITLLLGPISAAYQSARGENEVLQQLLLSFWDSNFFIFMSFIIAVCARRSREPYFLDIIFLDILSLFELLLLNIIALSILVSSFGHKEPDRYAGYTGLAFILDMWYWPIASPRQFQAQAFTDLTEACTQDLAQTLPDHFGVDFSWLTQQYIYQFWTWFWALCTIILAMFGWHFVVWLYATSDYVLAERIPILHQFPNVVAGAAVAAPTLSLLALGFLCTYELGFSRKLMAQAAAAMDQPFLDDDWGFGQILALTAWIPVLWAFMAVPFRVDDKRDAAEIKRQRDELLAAQQSP